MQPVSSANFGPLVAYLVPGATALYGLSEYSPVIRSWIISGGNGGPTIGGFLYLTIASIAVGMTVSALRWATIDTIHHRTGLRMPPLDFSKLGENVAAYTLLIKIHYEHYQFFSNALIATAIAYVCHRTATGRSAPLGTIDFAFVLIEVLFFMASRDTLHKYYARTSQLLSPRFKRSRRTQKS